MSRTREHVLETMSERTFVGMLPPAWTDHQIRHDYGIDLKVEIFTAGTDGGHSPTGMEFAVQLKATDSETPRRLRVGVDWGHIDYWQSLPYPTLMVRYCASDGAIYAMWVHERGRKNEARRRQQAWFHFTEADRLTTERWESIERDVEAFRRARSGQIHLPLRLRLLDLAPDAAWLLKTNAAFATAFGARQRLALDPGVPSALTVSIKPTEWSVDFGGGMAVVVHTTRRPGPFDLLFAIGVCLSRCGSDADAASCFEASSASPLGKSGPFLAAAVSSCRAVGRFDLVVELIMRCARDEPFRAIAEALLLNDVDRMDHSTRQRLEEEFRLSVRRAAHGLDRGIALFNQACLSRQLGQHTDAVRQYQKASTEWPAYEVRADYWRFRAGSEFLTGEYADAAASYARAIALGDDSPRIRELRFDALLESGEYDAIVQQAQASGELTAEASLIHLIAASVIDRWDIRRQRRRPDAANKLWDEGRFTGDDRQLAAIDALTPAVWWHPNRSPVKSDGTVEHPEYMLIAARLVDDNAELWSMALVLAALCKLPEHFIIAGVRRATLKVGPQFSEAIAHASELFDDSELEDREEIEQLLCLVTAAASEESPHARALTITDAATGTRLLDISQL